MRWSLRMRSTASSLIAPGPVWYCARCTGVHGASHSVCAITTAFGITIAMRSGRNASTIFVMSVSFGYWMQNGRKSGGAGISHMPSLVTMP